MRGYHYFTFSRTLADFLPFLSSLQQKFHSLPFLLIPYHSLPFLPILFYSLRKKNFTFLNHSVVFLTIQSQEKYLSVLFLAVPFQSFPFLPIPYPFFSIKKNMLVLGGIWILDLPPSTICLKVFPCVCYLYVFQLNKIFSYNNSI